MHYYNVNVQARMCLWIKSCKSRRSYCNLIEQTKKSVKTFLQSFKTGYLIKSNTPKTIIRQNHDGRCHGNMGTPYIGDPRPHFPGRIGTPVPILPVRWGPPVPISQVEWGPLVKIGTPAFALRYAESDVAGCYLMTDRAIVGLEGQGSLLIAVVDVPGRY